MLAQLQRYKCHKIVLAARILEAMHGEAGQAGMLLLEIPGGVLEHHVPADWMAKHEPEIGGYYVVYENDQGGYASYSPAQPFEDGYTLADPLAGIEALAGQQWNGPVEQLVRADDGNDWARGSQWTPDQLANACRCAGVDEFTFNRIRAYLPPAKGS